MGCRSSGGRAPQAPRIGPRPTEPAGYAPASVPLPRSGAAVGWPRFGCAGRAQSGRQGPARLRMQKRGVADKSRARQMRRSWRFTGVLRPSHSGVATSSREGPSQARRSAGDSPPAGRLASTALASPGSVPAPRCAAPGAQPAPTPLPSPDAPRLTAAMTDTKRVPRQRPGRTAHSASPTPK